MPYIPQNLLALGDSITTGFGLENYTPGGTPYLCPSYINTVANAMGLECERSYVNRAVNGHTSADLAALLSTLTDEVKAADLIVISIGGNDLLRPIPATASVASGTAVTSFADAIGVLSQISAADFVQLQCNPAFQSIINTMLEGFTSHLNEIADLIKSNAPGAKVILLKQYNPMKHAPAFGGFGNFADNFTSSINQVIDSLCAKTGFSCLDVPAIIDRDTTGLTNIASGDIHPNAQGHARIAELLKKHLQSMADQSVKA